MLALLDEGLDATMRAVRHSRWIGTRRTWIIALLILLAGVALYIAALWRALSAGGF